MIGQLGVLEWVFHMPIQKFGGYFENNSRFDDATLEFYDAQDQLIGVMNATVPRLANPGPGTDGSRPDRFTVSFREAMTSSSWRVLSGLMTCKLSLPMRQR